MVDQLPILGALHTYLEHLAMMDPPSAKQDLLLEQVCLDFHKTIIIYFMFIVF